MTDSPRNEAQARRRRWISLGETVAIAALAISALGLWNSWKPDKAEKRPPPIEAKAAIPIAFRGKIESDGKAMSIAPVEPGHSLESLTMSVAGKPAVSIGSDGQLAAAEIERLVDNTSKDKRPGSLSVRFEASYIEAGTLKHGGGGYRISYRWEDGGLFGSDKLRLTGLSHG
jgi:hypothetical protein